MIGALSRAISAQRVAMTMTITLQMAVSAAAARGVWAMVTLVSELGPARISPAG